MVWLIIILFCLGNSSSQILDVTNNSHLDFDYRLFGLLQRLQVEKFYDTLLVYGEDCAIPSLFERLQVPAVLVSSGSTNFDWNFSSLTLILSCNFQDEREENYRTLMKLQTSRRLILLKGHIKPESVCDLYSKKEQHNVAMVKENFYQLEVVYSCRLFQDQNYEKLNLFDGKSIYKDQFRNMHGAPIRTLSDKEPPRTIPYIDSKTGEEKFKGYVGMLISQFVKKVNATMKIREDLIKDDEEVSFVDITNFTSNDILDIGICEARTLEMSNYDAISYPYLMSSYCFMAPLPDSLPFSDVYMAIVAPSILIMFLIIFCICSVLIIYIQERSYRSLTIRSVLMNDICLRGFLAQPFPFPRQYNRKLKLIFMLVCFSSLISTTMYTAYLQAFLWGPPIEPRLTSFDDVKKSRYTMAINIYEREFLEALNVSLEDVEIYDYGKFSKLRSTFNTNYLFPVTALQWFTINEEQKLFKYKIFYYCDAFCLNQFDILSIPLRRHLPYRDIFEEHMLLQKEFGLTKYWIDQSYRDMIRANLTTFKDFSPPLENDYIEVHNLYWVFTMYFVGMGMGLCFFILEILRPLRYWRNCKIKCEYCYAFLKNFAK